MIGDEGGDACGHGFMQKNTWGVYGRFRVHLYILVWILVAIQY